MGYAQWVNLIIMNKGKSWTIQLKNAQKSWGKFYDGPTKDNEIGDDRINQISIGPGKEGSVWSCGRSDSSSGTEGTVDLYDGETRICTLYWSCPWSGSNSVQVRNTSDDYLVAVGTVDPSGPIGNVNIKVGKVA